MTIRTLYIAVAVVLLLATAAIRSMTAPRESVHEMCRAMTNQDDLSARTCEANGFSR
jgi:hypothetical protein